MGNFEESIPWFARCIASWREAGDEKGATWATNRLCSSLIRHGDLDEARRRAEENRVIVAELERSQGDAELHYVLAELAFAEGDAAAALAEIGGSLRTFRSLGVIDPVAWVLSLLARVLSSAQRPEEAAQALGIEAGWLERYELARIPAEQVLVDALTDELRSVLSDETFDAQYAAGFRLQESEAYAKALTVLA